MLIYKYKQQNDRKMQNFGTFPPPMRLSFSSSVLMSAIIDVLVSLKVPKVKFVSRAVSAQFFPLSDAGMEG